MKSLILGGASSGKSALAENLAMQIKLPVTYVATARTVDDEMKSRIARHRKRRPPEWQLIEEPLHLASALQQAAGARHCLLVDCLSVWLTNLLVEQNSRADDEIESLHSVLPALPGELLLVSTEAGLGVLPTDGLGRDFVVRLGELHQRVASLCERVLLSVAGLPCVLKGSLPGE